jgi:hypothetical protein
MGSHEKYKEEKKVLGVISEKVEQTQIQSNPTQSNPAPTQPSQIGQPSQDKMWHMKQQLTMILNQNNSKNFGIAINFTSNFS